MEIAYSRRSVTSRSDSGFCGKLRLDLAEARRSAMLVVAVVRRAAAFCGALLKTAVKLSGHLLYGEPSSIACSTFFVLASCDSMASLT